MKPCPKTTLVMKVQTNIGHSLENALFEPYNQLDKFESG